MKAAPHTMELQIEGRRNLADLPFSKHDFKIIAQIVKEYAGIDLHESKSSLVYSRLAKRIRALALPSFEKYCQAVRTDVDERHQMVSMLTTNVTSFFREAHHFEHLKSKILAPIVPAARRGEKIRIWSAACSSGQEPYSIALTVLSILPEAPSLDVRILATDLNADVVNKGRAAVYDRQEASAIPPALKSKWTSPCTVRDEPSFQISDEARSLVSFRELNLMQGWPMRGLFHAIFCRNVVIYFDRETQCKIWQRMASLLPVGGALYIGHSERISGPASSLLSPDGITAFRKIEVDSA